MKRAPVIISGIGLLMAFVSALDPFRPLGSYLGPLLAIAAALAGRKRALTVVALVAASYGVSSHLLIEFRADSSSYFAYLRSTSFDLDLDFRNDWDLLRGDNPAPFPTPREINVFSAGPAVLWSPFFWSAHLYVATDNFLGRELYPADGVSLPYRRSTVAGTIAVVVVGAALLVSTIAGTTGMTVAVLAVGGAVAASPVLYYTFLVPAMPHGVTFGVASAFIWAWDRLRREPSLNRWILVGGLFGLLTMCRWQAAVFALLPLSVAVEGLWKKTLPLQWLLAAAAAALIALAPQSFAWKLGFDRWILIPQGRGFLNFSSPHWLDTLVSADHGFFNWTPLMLVGFVGLWSGLRADLRLYGGCLAIFLATAWVNGSVPEHDWAAGDAFGARRYSLVVPLMALGVARMLTLGRKTAQRWPLLAPAAAVVLLVAWNLGFVSHFRARKYPGAAPIERLAADQARALRRTMQDFMGAVAGSEGRSLAYKYFSAEYFYTDFNKSGAILLRSADESYLLEGWHTPSRRIARRTFRRALYPQACVRIPLEEPFPLRVTTSARAPDGIASQTVTFVVNETTLATTKLPLEWRDIAVEVPQDALVPGENAFCLVFSNALPDEGNGKRVAAFVERIQLP